MFRRKLFLIPIALVLVLGIAIPALAVALPNQDGIPVSVLPSDIGKTGGYVVVEPSGVCKEKGMVQVRFAMYLYPDDYGYEKHHVQVPVIPAGGYPGKVDKEGSPIDINGYNKWIDSLPKVWQNNPFHNHFILVEPTMSDEEIMNIGETFLREAYDKWSANNQLDLKNAPVSYPVTIDSTRLSAIDSKVQHLKTTSLKRENTLSK